MVPDVQTPASPLGNFPELAQMYRSSFQLPLSNAGVSAQSANDQTTLANQKAQADSQKQIQSYLNDPKNYQQVQLPDGGFGFYDPSGKAVTAAQYAAATGKAPTDVLKNSTNPVDIGYQKDFSDLQSYINNKLQSATNAGARVKAQNVENQIKNNASLTKINGGQPVDISKMTPAQLIQTFQHAYPTVYGLTNTGVPSNQVFIPNSQI